ncbi:MAG: dTDP-4-dehydrorhamnose 3,5-epimerase family protein [Candidatus Marinimicrobia bacterium]|nr:dTDP-4-dehydrorhamnose 3,5-epimerase family protein [Candidatus Neomarinimicrobiota bacterium]
MELLNKFEKNIKTQDYSSKTEIDGVEIVSLKRLNDETGSLTELLRLNAGSVENIPAFQLEQINFSEIDGGMIKAFHVHKKQTDLWYVPPGHKILLLLVDLRKNSATQENIMRIVLGDGNSRLIVIPPGIAHGCKNLYQDKGEIIYFVNNKFDPEPENCDEWRLSWDAFGEEVWTLSKE